MLRWKKKKLVMKKASQNNNQCNGALLIHIELSPAPIINSDIDLKI